MTYLETMKYLLLNYPVLWDSPLSASIYLFTSIGSGYEWDANGNLTSTSTIPKRNGPEFLKDTSDLIEHQLENKAQRWKYQFIAENIEEILTAKCTLDIFEKRPRIKDRCHFSAGYMPAFIFPDNIQKDWALALIDFLLHWKSELQQFKMDGEYEAEVHKALNRLYNIIYGESYDKIFADQCQLAQEIIDEILAERKS